MKKHKGIFRRYFITGFAVFVPIALTIYIIKVVVIKLDAVFRFLPPKFHPDTYLPFHIPGLGLLATLLIILIIGLLAKNFFGRKIVHWVEGIFKNIPLVRVIYTAISGFVKALFSDSSEAFRQAALVEFPRKGIYSMGYVVGESDSDLFPGLGSDYVKMFIPTTPNITTGFFILVKKDQVKPIDVNPQEAFKIIISAGVVTPERFGGIGEQLHDQAES
jgi:uncharacterized membrane protein